MTLSATEYNAAGKTVSMLPQSVTVLPGETGEVLAEQSEYREVQYLVQNTENFHHTQIKLQDDLSLAGITVRDDQNNTYLLKSAGWMSHL